MRLLKDRDLLVRKAQSWELREGAEVPFPESVQALIAARLDTLEAGREVAAGGRGGDREGVLGRGGGGDGRPRPANRDHHSEGVVAQGTGEAVEAVVDGGRGGVCVLACAGPRCRLQPAAPRLACRPSCRCRRRGSSRKRPSGSKTWLTCSPTTTRPPWSSPSAAGQTDQAAELEAPALRFLGAGRRARPRAGHRGGTRELRAGAGAHPRGHPERAAALARFGEAAFQAGRFGEAKDALEEAIEAFEAPAIVVAPRRRWHLQQGARPARRSPRMGAARRGVGVVEPLPPGPEHVAALTAARHRGDVARKKRGRDRLRRAGARAGHATRPRAKPARALGYRGLARAYFGDRVAGRLPEGDCACNGSRAGKRGGRAPANNLGVGSGRSKGRRAALEVLDGAIAFARPRGLAWMGRAGDASKLDSALRQWRA